MKKILFFKNDQEGEEDWYNRLPEEMKLHNLICEVLYAVIGGINCSFEIGYLAANKYAKHVLKRKARKNA